MARFRFGDFDFDPSEELLLKHGEPVRLDYQTARLLECLVGRAGELISKDELLAEVWEVEVVSDAALTQAVARLRNALGDDARAPSYIETVHRRGFRFIASLQPNFTTVPSKKDLVGRDHELEQLALARAAAEQERRQTVIVRGEMGIGKTTLIDFFAESLPGNWRILRSQCVEQYGTREPYLPVLEALEDFSKSSHGPELVDVLRRHAPNLLAQMPWLVDEQEAQRLRDGLAAGTRPAMLRQTASALEALCGDGLLLVVEDLHWSDPATVDLLGLISRRRGAANLLILGSLRDGQAIAYGQAPLEERIDRGHRQRLE